MVNTWRETWEKTYGESGGTLSSSRGKEANVGNRAAFVKSGKEGIIEELEEME